MPKEKEQLKTRISKKRRYDFRNGYKKDLRVNRKGILVSIKRSENASNLKWPRSVRDARHNLGVTGFVPVGGKSKNGTALLAEAHRLYSEKIRQDTD